MQPLKIFISYTQTDRPWAEWIAWQVEAVGHEARIQAWDFAVGGNFVDAMDEAAKWADVTMPVLSPGYLKSGHCKAEWTAAFARDPLGREGRLIPVRVRDFNVDGLLGPVVHVDLVGLGAEDARVRLVEGLQRGRRKPETEPPFPGLLEGSESAPKAEPAFPRAVFVGVPHRNPYFTGRVELLTQLHEELQAAGSAALAQAAIHGLGGIGKTQTAIEYAHRHRDLYRFVLWVAAESESSLGSSYLAIARELALVEAKADLEMAVAAVKGWLAREDGWLLVFDNADDPALVRGYLPATRTGGKVLLTSRASSFKAVGIKQPFRVRTMEPDDAVKFLIGRTDRDEPTAAAALAAELGYLPLALEQAAAYVDTVGVSLAAYLASFRHRGLKLLEKGRPGADYPASVTTTWNLSIGKVGEVSPASVELLHAAAFLDPDAIPIEIFTLGGAELGGLLVDALRGAAEDPVIFWELLEPLERYSLVERLPDNAFKLHRLTQEVVKDSLGEEGRRAWAERVVRALNAAYPDVEFENWPFCERLQPHAMFALHWFAEQKLKAVEAAGLFTDAGRFSHVRGELSVAALLGRRSLEIRQEALGPEHPHTLASMNNLADTLRALGDIPGARKLHEQTLRILERVLGSEHPQTLVSMSNLALTLSALGDHAGARNLHERTLKIRERVLGSEHPFTLMAMNNLAGTLWKLGEGAVAKALFEQTLERYERALGLEHPDTTRPVWWLLTIAQEENDPAATARWFEKLRWLAERDEESIASAEQRDARRYVLAVIAKLE